MSKYFRHMDSTDSGLAGKFKVNPESCDYPNHYEDYIKLNAVSDQISGLGATHLLVHKNDETKEERIIGFVTLRASSLIKSYENFEEGHAALEICQLAVDQDYERQGNGSLLVKYAMVTASELKNETGIEYIVLCSDRSAVKFYHDEFEFGNFDNDYKMGRDGWNNDCQAMYIKLPDLNT